MSNSILLLSQPSCRPCGFVKNLLEESSVDYQLVDITQENEYIDKFGIMSTPVTILIDENNEEIIRVNGFDPESIEMMIEQL